MKNHSIVFAFFLQLNIAAFSQQVLPKIDNQLNRDELQKRTMVEQINQLQELKSTKMLDTNQIHQNIKSTKSMITTLKGTELVKKTAELVQLENTLEVVEGQLDVIDNNIGNLTNQLSQLPIIPPNSPHHLFIYGTGSLDGLGIDQLTSLGNLNVGLKLSKRFFTNLSFNYSGTIATNNADSLFVEQLYFPDISKTAFCSSVQIDWTPKRILEKKRHHFMANLEFSAQNRKLTLDTNTFNINIANSYFGPMYRWEYYSSDETKNGVLTVTAGLSSIYLFNQNARTFRDVLAIQEETQGTNDSDNRLFIHGFSAQVALQLNNAAVYFRTFDDLSEKSGFAFTVGIKFHGILLSY